MEIHILRDGKQIGPFSESTVQSLLKQGNILINDLAWSPGMTEWNPLHVVLYPAAQPPPPPAGATPPPMPAPSLVMEASVAEAVAVEVEPAPVEEADSATPRQKAFLTFFAVPFSSDLTKERAALLVNDAMENPKNSGRLRRWEDERLRLYPDLFADEIKARRENRSQQFLEICQAEGAEFFDGVTKAHTQVLVGYLDVRYPTWDHTEQAAKYDYFFPAIAEKFPQLLKKGAKGRFKYPDGPKVAAELVGSPAAVRARPKKSPVAAMVRGVLMGGILLALVVGGVEFQRRGGIAAVQQAIAKATAAAKTEQPKSVVTKPVASSEPAKALTPAAKPAAPASVAPASTSLVAQASAPETTPSASLSAATAPASTPAADPSMATPAAPSSSQSLFDTTPPPAAPPAATESLTPAAVNPAPAAPAAPQRVIAKITKPTLVALKFGTSTLRPGTPVQVVSVSGANLTIKFGPETVTIPVSNTDYAEAPTTASLPSLQ